MAKRLQGVLDDTTNIPDLAEALDKDYESLDETPTSGMIRSPAINRRRKMSAMPLLRRLRASAL